MGSINISQLERNEATKPFHVAAGLEAFDNTPWELSENECLFYQIHQGYDVFLRTPAEAQTFLKSIEPKKAKEFQDKAGEMFGMAKLFVEGSRLDNIRQGIGKVESLEVSGDKFLEVYKKNPNIKTIAALKEKMARQIEDAIFASRMGEISTGKKENDCLGTGDIIFRSLIFLGFIAPLIVDGIFGVGDFSMLPPIKGKEDFF